MTELRRVCTICKNKPTKHIKVEYYLCDEHSEKDVALRDFGIEKYDVKGVPKNDL
jgi:hypothetical protein